MEKPRQLIAHIKLSIVVSFHYNPEEGKDKECSDYCTIALISHASKVMLKIIQFRLQQYVNWKLPDVQAGFREGR